MEWINVKDKLPSHMQEVRVWIHDPYFGSCERAENAVFLAFSGADFYDSAEQIQLHHVTKWKPV